MIWCKTTSQAVRHGETIFLKWLDFHPVQSANTYSLQHVKGSGLALLPFVQLHGQFWCSPLQLKGWTICRNLTSIPVSNGNGRPCGSAVRGFHTLRKADGQHMCSKDFKGCCWTQSSNTRVWSWETWICNDTHNHTYMTICIYIYIYISIYL